MKKLLILLVIIGLLASCDETTTKESSNKVDEYEYSGGIWNSTEYKIEQTKIDSCEYIIILGVEGRTIIHKANCKNH